MLTFEFSLVTLLQFVLAIVLPLLVAIVTTRVTSGRKRGILLAAITLVTGLLTQIVGALVSGTPLDLFSVVLTLLISFVISVGFHFGLWGASGPPNPVTGEPRPSISTYLIDNVGRTTP